MAMVTMRERKKPQKLPAIKPAKSERKMDNDDEGNGRWCAGMKSSSGFCRCPHTHTTHTHNGGSSADYQPA